ncbi:hypothetical protein [Exiguobacterium aurantiacum]|uniref:Uncharacterized protein n=1 Tax=Exiguobacterium aurantiacum TaxID=33987 RepID=A0ABY5FQB0_9BACL|nr:hypothetical protein [Exiguobacterium aurantiacum]UTT43705.1 hypothetical protein NMQ00_04150 [Exiguobacterium aurantiacum]
MKKLLIYASVVGTTIRVVYWLFLKVKSNHTSCRLEDKKIDFEPKQRQNESSPNVNVLEQTIEAKSENARAIYERHSVAREILRDAYSNITEDFVEDFSSEKEMNQENMVDNKHISVMKETDLISDELDELLK